MASIAPPHHCQAFWLPKGGHAVEEYEDAHAADPQRGRFAIADGATESCFAGLWARLLVDHFVQPTGPVPAPGGNWLAPPQERWFREVGSRELPWYAEAKVQQGAFATLLGLVVTAQPGARKPIRRWHALAVGDSCLFQTGGGKLRRAFPLKRSRDFGNSPWLVGSRSPPAGLLHGELRTEGSWRSGDRLWLMTDALAQWFLQQHETRNRPWEMLELLLEPSAPAEGFRTWIEQLRKRSQLRNDDVTLLAVSLGDCPPTA